MGRVCAADPVIEIVWNYGRGFFTESAAFFLGKEHVTDMLRRKGLSNDDSC